MVLIQRVEAILRIDQAVGGQDVHVGMESQVVAKGVDDGDSSNLSMRSFEGGLHPEFQGFYGLLEEVSEKFAALAEDGSKEFGNGEDIHAMGNIEGDVFGDPIGGFKRAALMA